MDNMETLKAEIKSILACKAKEGATFSEIQSEYLELIGKNLAFNSIKEFSKFTRSMKDVIRRRNEHREYVWHTSSEKSKHIVDLVLNQKNRSNPVKSFHSSTTNLRSSNCYYSDNALYHQNRKYKSDPNINLIKSAALFEDYELIGDDFFLNIANLDFKHPLKQFRSKLNGRPVKRCGQCVSGQTIAQVVQMLKSNAVVRKKVILNIGSVDLLNGTSLKILTKDFNELYDEFEKRNIRPIITTIAPLANKRFMTDVQSTWSMFNSYLFNNFPNVVDISHCFISNGVLDYNAYQSSPKYVTGSVKPHSLWSFQGRQRVNKYIKQYIIELKYQENQFKYS